MASTAGPHVRLPPPPPWAGVSSGGSASSCGGAADERLARLVRMLAAMVEWEQRRADALSHSGPDTHSAAALARRRTRARQSSRPAASAAATAAVSAATRTSSTPSASASVTPTAAAISSSQQSGPKGAASSIPSAAPPFDDLDDMDLSSDEDLLDQAGSLMARLWAQRWESAQHTARLAASAYPATAHDSPPLQRSGRATPISPFSLSPNITDDTAASFPPGKRRAVRPNTALQRQRSTSLVQPWDWSDERGSEAASQDGSPCPDEDVHDRSHPPNAVPIPSPHPPLMPIPSQMLGGESPTTVMRDLELAYVPTDGEDEEHSPLPKLSAEEELRLLKAQVQDIARVCKVCPNLRNEAGN